MLSTGGVSKTKNNKIHWLSWDKLTRPKKKGGLEFKDLHLFDMTMLCRQAWRLLTNPDTLCGQVLKAKYFTQSDILSCRPYDVRSILYRAGITKGRLDLENRQWRKG